MVVPIQEPGSTTERVQSKTLTKRVPAIAAVKRLQISIILQEGAAPELIENIRQVVMVAARFDRTRGDVLSIMTASFKERRDEKSAEQVLLKNIADKLEMLQSGEGDDALTRSIEKEISGPLLELKEQLNNLERRSAADKFEFERKTALLRDSLQLRALKDEITSLKNELSYANDARVDSQLTNRIATLDSIQLGLGQEIEQVESSSALIILVSILGALVVALLVLVVILLLKKKQGPQQPQMPMPWPYPPPPFRRKKKRKTAPVANNASNEAQEDPDVIRGEIGEMRQSVVSMSVGQPKTATRIVKEWIEDDVIPEPEPEAPPEEPEEEDSGKKKKKKK
jgi:flagellar biosynthesis/type III secretory pathway M-ring protein FliF/YscJ